MKTGFFKRRKERKIKANLERGYKWVMYEYCANGMPLDELSSCIFMPSSVVVPGVLFKSQKCKRVEIAFDVGANNAINYIKSNIEFSEGVASV